MLTIQLEQVQVFDAAVRDRLGRDVIRGLRADLPQAVRGLTAAEIDERLQTALGMAEQHQLRAARDLRAFVRLCFVVGPRFADHPRVRSLLRLAAHRPGDRLGALFAGMQAEDWQHAAEHDIVSRARQPLPAVHLVNHGRTVMPACAVAAVPRVSLEPLAAEHAGDYLAHASHPDVWRLGRMRQLATRDEAVSHIRQCRAGADRQAYAIVDAHGRCQGAITLRGGPAPAHVAYWVARPLWGRGVATQALRQLHGLLQGQSQGVRLRAEIAATNRLSIRLVERLGWTALAPAQARSVHRVFEIQV